MLYQTGGRADDNIYQKVIEDDNPWSLGNTYDDLPINHYAEISECSVSDWHTYDRSLSYEPAHPVSFNVDEDWRSGPVPVQKDGCLEGRVGDSK